MLRDRLSELQAIVSAGDLSTKAIFNQAHEDLDRMQGLVEKMAMVHADIFTSIDQKSNRIDPIVQEFQLAATRVRTLLREVRDSVDPNDKSARGRMQWTQYQAVSQRFGVVAKDFNSEQMSYREKCKHRIRRQLEIMGKIATDEQVEDMLCQNDIFVGEASQLQIDEARVVLDEMRERQRDIEKLEESVRVVTELFKETTMLIEEQGEKINRIQENVQSATVFVDDGADQLSQAKKNQASARRRKFWILFYVILAIIILVIIIILASR